MSPTVAKPKAPHDYFQSPQILSKNNQVQAKIGSRSYLYDFNKPGALTLAYRVPHNPIGQSLRRATKITQDINKDLMVEKLQRRIKGVSPIAPSVEGV